jgi:hypothetical protein
MSLQKLSTSSLSSLTFRNPSFWRIFETKPVCIIVLCRSFDNQLQSFSKSYPAFHSFWQITRDCLCDLWTAKYSALCPWLSTMFTSHPFLIRRQHNFSFPSQSPVSMAVFPVLSVLFRSAPEIMMIKAIKYDFYGNRQF